MDQRKQVASVTKTATLYTVIEVCKRYQMDPCQTRIKVCKLGSTISGTSARLQEGDILTVEDLCYGLMLPSGNDAAFVLAKYFGKLLFEKKGYTEKDKTRIRSFEFDNHNTFVKYFLREMNELAAGLGMKNTHWDSPHGLNNKESLTTVTDMFKLCEKVKQQPLHLEVNKTKVYRCNALVE